MRGKATRMWFQSSTVSEPLPFLFPLPVRVNEKLQAGSTIPGTVFYHMPTGQLSNYSVRGYLTHRFLLSTCQFASSWFKQREVEEGEDVNCHR